VNARALDAVVADAWRATAAANRRLPVLFRRGTLLVRLMRDERGVRIEALSEAGVINHLSVVADWVRVTEQGDIRGFPSKDAARSMLDLPDPGLPALDAIVATPVFGHDGALVERPGHDAEARVWYEPPPGFKVPEVPDIPTEADVAAAKALLLDELLCDFPFVDAAARAHMLAALLLPFVRRLIRGPTPIHLFEAPAEGSGKNLLVNLVSVIVTGSAVTGGSIPEDEDEVRKKIGAELASGRPLLVLDNADTKKRLDSSAIASATTMWPEWSDRLLGHNKTFSVPNDVLWVLTGNNPRLSREIARRCVSVRIDPKLDRPWLRKDFRHPDLLDWTAAERPQLVRAVLVLVRNWLAQGRPRGTVRLGSFERWSETVGGILAAAGIEGFLGNLEALYATADAEGSMWRAFVAAWWEEHGETPVRLADLLALCEKGDLMPTLLGDGSPRSQSTRLGNALAGARDRVFGAQRIESAGRDSHSKAALYRLRPMASTATSESPPSPVATTAPPDEVPDFLPSLDDFEEAP
jgi:hypothetical protein